MSNPVEDRLAELAPEEQREIAGGCILCDAVEGCRLLYEKLIAEPMRRLVQAAQGGGAQ